MSMLTLLFDGKAYSVPRESVSQLLEHSELLQGETYTVRCSQEVPLPVFEVFLDSLKTQTAISVTPENAVPLSILAKEFFVGEVAETPHFSLSLERFARLCKILEFSGFGKDGLMRDRCVTTRPGSQEPGTVMVSFQGTDVVGDIAADWRGPSFEFMSRYSIHGWTCWDFGVLHVRVTDCHISGVFLGAWVVEGSVDGESWTEMHHEPAIRHDKDYSFSIPKPMESRFIRLTPQTIPPEYQLKSAEFFGSFC
jgi:hypothetical protein